MHRLIGWALAFSLFSTGIAQAASIYEANTSQLAAGTFLVGGTDRGLSVAEFTIDLSTLTLDSFTVQSNTADPGYSLQLSGPAALTDLGGGYYQLVGGGATLVTPDASQPVLVLSGEFTITGPGEISGNFFGSTDGSPAVDLLAFDADLTGQTTNGSTAIPEPGSQLLLMAGMLVIGWAVRARPLIQQA